LPTQFPEVVDVPREKAYPVCINTDELGILLTATNLFLIDIDAQHSIAQLMGRQAESPIATTRIQGGDISGEKVTNEFPADANSKIIARKQQTFHKKVCDG
jgi:hypothetical protein